MTVQPFKTQGDAGAKLANLLITGQTVAVTGAGQPLTLGLADQTSWVFDTDGATVLPQGGLITETSGSITITPADFGGAENTAWYSVFGDQKIPRTGNVDYGASTAYDSTGNLYVIGGHVDTSNYLTGDNIALKYDQYGNLLVRKAWTTPEGMPCGSVHSALKIDRSTDAIYWASTEVTQEFNARNSYVGVMDTELNITTAPLLIRNIVVQEIQINEPGILTIGGTYVEVEANFPVIAKINLNINQLVWVSRADAIGVTEYNGNINSIVIDGLGNTWAVGSYQPNGFYNNPFLARFDTGGVNTGFWNIASLSTNDGNINGVSVAINGGYLYTLLNALGSSGDSVIAKWDISGDPARIWMQAIDLGGGTFANNMQFDDGGDLYLVGQTYDVPVNSDYYVAKIDPGNGSAIWQRTFGSDGSDEGGSPTGFITKYVDILGSNMAWTGATSTNPLDPGNYDGDYVITLQLPTDGSLTGQLGLFNYTEVDFPFTQPVGYDIVAVSVSFSMVSPTVSTNTMIADSVLKSRRYIPYRYDLINHAITRPYNWTFNNIGSTTMPNFFISGNIQNGGSRLGDSDQFLLLSGSGAVVLQSRYNSGTPVIIQGANCPDGGLAGDVYVNAGHSEVPSNDGDTRQGNVFITAGPGAIWQFDSNAGLTFPDTSVQMTAWQGNAAIVSDTAPIAEYGAVWFNTLDARTYVNYNGTWVDANPTVLAPPSTYVGNLDIEGASITSVTIGEPVEINGWQFNNDSTVTASGDLVPDSDSIYSLGSAGRQWKDLYVSNTTIYVGGTPVSVVDGSLTVGGNVVSGNASTGNITFTGSELSSIDDADISLVTNGNTWTFGSTGNLTLPIGGHINAAPTVNYGNGNSIVLTAGSTNGCVSVAGSVVINAGNGNTIQKAGNILLNTQGGTWEFSANGTTTLPNGAKLNNGTSLQFATDNTVVTSLDLRDTTGRGFYTDSDGFSLRANGSKTWNFGTGGVLTLPSDNYLETTDTDLKVGSHGVIIIRSNATYSETTKSWTFGSAGDLTLPAAGNVTNNGNTWTFGSAGNLTLPAAGTVTNNGNTWTFGADGTLILPVGGEIVSAAGTGNVIITANNGTSRSWTFDGAGNLTLPPGGTVNYSDGSNALVGGGTADLGNYSFSGDSMLMPLHARMNSGGVGNTNSAEFGTVVNTYGDNGVVQNSQIYMSAGTGEARILVNMAGDTLVYYGTEEVENPNFAGMVAMDPNVRSQYAIALDSNSNIILGGAQPGGTLTSSDYIAGLGSLNSDYNLNGVYVDTMRTVVSGIDNVSIQTGGGNIWTFSSAGNLTLPVGGTINYSDGSNALVGGGSAGFNPTTLVQNIAITGAISRSGDGNFTVNYTATSHAPINSTGIVASCEGITVYAEGNTSTDSQSVDGGFGSGHGDRPYTAYAFVTTNVGTIWSTVAAGSTGLCLIAGTRVTMADGTTKLIEDISYSDQIQVWDFDTAGFASATALWIKRVETAVAYNELMFSDGSVLRTVDQHRIFNKQAGAFTYPMTDDTPLGTITYTVDDAEVVLVGKRVVTGTVDYYNVITDGHMNLFANGILTSCRFSNAYPIDNMRWVKNHRPLRDRAEFTGIADRWINGLRLCEQTYTVADIRWYVTRLESLEIADLALAA